MSKALLVTVLAALVGSGCVYTPLAESAYPVSRRADLVGEWNMQLYWPIVSDDHADPDEDEPSLIPYMVEVRGGEHPSDSKYADHRDTFEGGRLRLDLTPQLKREENTDEEFIEALSFSLVGNVVETQGRTFFTCQKNADLMRSLDLFETQLQRTFLLETYGDSLELYMHPQQFVWTSLPFAGTLAFDPDSAESTSLVQRFDDAIEFYTSTARSEWILIAKAERRQ